MAEVQVVEQPQGLSEKKTGVDQNQTAFCPDGSF